MAGKTGKIVNLEAIEELLKQHSVETERHTLIAVSLAMILAGITFVIISIAPAYVAAYGLFLIVLGTSVFVLRGRIAGK